MWKFIATLWISFLPTVYALECTTPPSLQAMDQAFLLSLKEQTDSQKIRVAIFPFQDDSHTQIDSTFEFLFPMSLYELLSTSTLGVFHPYITLDALQKANISSQSYFGTEPLALASQMGATHAITGMFQKQPDGQVRYFLKITEMGKDKPSSVLEFQAAQGDRFFEIIAESGKKILAQIGLKGISKNVASAYQRGSPTFESYRFYIKGMLGSRSYNETELSIAKIWFEKAFALSYHNPKSRDQVARVLLMQALRDRQTHKETSLLISEAKATLNATSFIGFSKRWLEGHSSFVSGVSLFQGGQYKEAAHHLKKAVLAVPEDGMAHYYLSQALEKIGNKDTAQTLQEARKFLTCL